MNRAKCHLESNFELLHSFSRTVVFGFPLSQVLGHSSTAGYENLILQKLPKICMYIMGRQSSNQISLVIIMKLLVLGIGYISLNCWPKRSNRNSQTTHAVVRTIGCSPQTYDKAPLLKITHTQLTEHGEVELVPTQSLHSMCQYLMCLLKDKERGNMFYGSV